MYANLTLGQTKAPANASQLPVHAMQQMKAVLALHNQEMYTKVVLKPRTTSCERLVYTAGSPPASEQQVLPVETCSGIQRCSDLCLTKPLCAGVFVLTRLFSVTESICFLQENYYSLSKAVPVSVESYQFFFSFPSVWCFVCQGSGKLADKATCFVMAFSQLHRCPLFLPHPHSMSSCFLADPLLPKSPPFAFMSCVSHYLLHPLSSFLPFIVSSLAPPQHTSIPI